MVAVNSPAPSFSLADLAGRFHRLAISRATDIIEFLVGGMPVVATGRPEMGRWPPDLAKATVMVRVAMNADEAAGESAARPPIVSRESCCLIPTEK